MRRRAGVSTPGHGQGEGPDGYKSSRSVDAVDVGRGRSERSERSPAHCWQPPGKTPATHSRGAGRPDLHTADRSGKVSGAGRLVLHTAGLSWQVPGAGRPVLHTGGMITRVPGAQRPDLHTAGRRWQVPGAERPVLHTEGRNGQLPGAERGFLHTKGRSGQAPGAGRPVLHTGSLQKSRQGASRPAPGASASFSEKNEQRRCPRNEVKRQCPPGDRCGAARGT